MNGKNVKIEITELLKLSIPIILSQMAQTTMAFVDTVSAGKYATDDLAAIAIGSSLWLPIFLSFAAVLMAISPKVSFYFGANNRKKIINSTFQGIWLGLFIGIIAFFLLRFSTDLLDLMNIETNVSKIAKDYVHAVSWGIPAIIIYQTLRFYNDALNFTKITMTISFIGLVLNIVFNYILVFGHFGFEELGGVGCGWATSIVMWSMLVIIILVTLIFPEYKRYFLYYKFIKPDLKEILGLFKLGLPIGIATFVEVSIFTTIALLIIPFGTDIVAAHQIALNFSSLLFMIPYSLSLGITVRVGQFLGKKDFSGAKFVSYTGMFFTAFLAFISVLLILIFSKQIVSIYSSDVSILNIASYLLMFAAIYQIPDSFQISAAGALRGYKSTKTHMLITFISFWVIALPTGYYLAHYGLGHPLKAAGFWISLSIGLSVAAVLLNIKLYKIVNR
jgi:MATE family multidrug resistance protein